MTLVAVVLDVCWTPLPGAPSAQPWPLSCLLCPAGKGRGRGIAGLGGI